MNFFFKKINLVIIGIALVFCVACGSNNDKTVSPTIKEGVFIDSPVEGLVYTSGSQSGQTDASGKFKYEEGQNVEFKIGNVVVGSAIGSDIITPVSLVSGATGTTNTTVQNIARFLQTLDFDGDTSNGITIAPSTIIKLSSAIIDFSIEATEFKEKMKKDYNINLISIKEATAHLDESIGTTQSSIIGSWGTDGVLGVNDYFLLNFYSNGTYIHAQSQDADSCNPVNLAGGVEYGNYTYNSTTKELIVEPLVDANGCVGLSDDGATITHLLTINGDSLTVTVEGEGDYVAERLVNAAKPIVGSWGTNGVLGVNDYFLINFYSNGTYIHAQSQEADDCNPVNLAGGVEYGNYTYNSTTKELIVEPLVDANGCVGLSSPNDDGATITHLLTINGDSFTITSEGDGDYVAERLK